MQPQLYFHLFLPSNSLPHPSPPHPPESLSLSLSLQFTLGSSGSVDMECLWILGFLYSLMGLTFLPVCMDSSEWLQVWMIGLQAITLIFFILANFIIIWWHWNDSIPGNFQRLFIVSFLMSWFFISKLVNLKSMDKNPVEFSILHALNLVELTVLLSLMKEKKCRGPNWPKLLLLNLEVI